MIKPATILANAGYDPFAEMVAVVKQLQELLRTYTEMNDTAAIHAVCVSLVRANDILCGYSHPKLKATEVSVRSEDDAIATMTIEQQIDALSAIALALGYKLERASALRSKEPR